MRSHESEASYDDDDDDDEEEDGDPVVDVDVALLHCRVCRARRGTFSCSTTSC